jgi:hypothetical protein
LLHEENIFSWIEVKEDEKEVNEKNNIKKVNKDLEKVVSNSFQEVDNNLFYY